MTVRPRARVAHAREINPPSTWALTSAEVRVVQSLMTGLRPFEIAASLGLSVHTIRTHLKRAMFKAGVHSQAALVTRVYSSRPCGQAYRTLFRASGGSRGKPKPV
jgi:DNA-binding CsgD family transcriptional regulator